MQNAHHHCLPSGSKRNGRTVPPLPQDSLGGTAQHARLGLGSSVGTPRTQDHAQVRHWCVHSRNPLRNNPGNPGLGPSHRQPCRQASPPTSCPKECRPLSTSAGRPSRPPDSVPPTITETRQPTARARLHPGGQSLPSSDPALPGAVPCHRMERNRCEG